MIRAEKLRQQSKQRYEVQKKQKQRIEKIAAANQAAALPNYYPVKNYPEAAAHFGK